ncbi:MAG TPA: septum formation initiator family protein [Gemmatimonadales bacterium]|nr:septum formation initiator family protein [Gemmatimonadales bacterium]
MTPGRWAAIAVLLAAVVFALQGGEYSTRDLFKLESQVASEAAEVARLQEVVDSLTRAAVAIERDPRVQERVARESFGMIRKGEFLYKIVRPDSAAGH